MLQVIDKYFVSLEKLNHSLHLCKFPLGSLSRVCLIQHPPQGEVWKQRRRARHPYLPALWKTAFNWQFWLSTWLHSQSTKNPSPLVKNFLDWIIWGGMVHSKFGTIVGDFLTFLLVSSFALLLRHSVTDIRNYYFFQNRLKISSFLGLSRDSGTGLGLLRHPIS